jgi:hypothetical protein
VFESFFSHSFLSAKPLWCHVSRHPIIWSPARAKDYGNNVLFAGFSTDAASQKKGLSKDCCLSSMVPRLEITYLVS